MSVEPDEFHLLPDPWRQALHEELTQPYVNDLRQFLRAERQAQPVYPGVNDVFRAFDLMPPRSVRVLILGQDPYHDEGQAHGLCFSVPIGVRLPPSLVNIFKELEADLGIPRPSHGCLDSWARQGVLLLNSVLTVRAHEPASHKNRGWEQFTDAVIRTVCSQDQPVVFVLWGAWAQKKATLIPGERHPILTSAHPSPLSARTGFFGSRPFSKINLLLEQSGQSPIDWRLEEGAKRGE